MSTVVDEIGSVGALGDSSTASPQKVESPTNANGESPMKGVNSVSTANADSMGTDLSMVSSLADKRQVPNPPSGDISPHTAATTTSAGTSNNNGHDQSPGEDRKRAYEAETKEDDIALFPPHSRAFKNRHFDPSLISTETTTAKDIPEAPESVGNREDQVVNQGASNKKKRALVRTRAVLEWLEATFPLQSAAAIHGGDKEEPYNTPLSLQMKSLRESAGIVEPTTTKNVLKVKEVTSTDTFSCQENTLVSTSIKKIQFRSSEHITKDFSGVVPSSHPASHAAQFTCGQGVVHSRMVVPNAPLFKGESGLVEERIVVLRAQIEELDRRTVPLM